MKTSKLLITSLLAAAAMGTNAFGALLETITADPGSSVTKTITSGDEIDLNFGSNGVSVTCAFELSGEDGTFTIGAPKGWKTYILEGAITGSGTLTLKGGTVAGYAFGWALANDMSGFSGKIKLENSNGGINQLKLRGNNGSSFASIEVDLNKYGSTQRNILLVETTATIKGISGTSTDAYVLSNGAQTLTLNTAGSDFSFAGAVGTGVQFATDSSSTPNTNAGTLSLVKTGLGTQTLSGTTYLGNLDVSGGNLVLSGTANIAGTTTVTGGTLDLSGGTITLANAIQNSGTVTISDTTVFNLTQPGATTLIDGGTIAGVDWNSLTDSNFTYNGTAVVGRGLTSSSVGVVSYDANATAKTLTWNGADSAVWKTATFAEAADKPWLDGSGTAEVFYSGDSVTFGSATAGRNVALAGVISSGAVAVEDSHTFTFGEGATLTASSMSIADGKTLTLSGTGTIGSAISGAGSVTIAENAEITFSAAASFAGTATVNGTAILSNSSDLAYLGTGDIVGSGDIRLKVKDEFDASRLSNFSGTLVLAEGNRMCFTSASASALGNLSIRVESGRQLFLDGYSGDNRANSFSNELTIAGAGYDSKDTDAAALRLHETSTLSGRLTLSDDATVYVQGGTNTISGGISAAGKTLTINGANTLNISGTADITIGTLTLKKSGDTNLSATGTTTIGTLNITNGTTNFTGATNITSATVTGGTLKFGFDALNNAATFSSASTLAVNGGTAIFGYGSGGGSTITGDSFGQNLSIVVGSGAQMTIAIAENSMKAFAGNLTLKNGATYSKFDGGVELAGNVTLGEADSDVVYLLGTWGKLGTKISGALSGSGTAYFGKKRGHDSNDTDTEVLTISGEGNSYSGEIVVGKKDADTPSANNTELILSTATALQNGKVNLAGSAADNYAQLTLGSDAITIAGLSGTEFGKVALGSGVSSSTLTLNQASDTTFSGTIADGIALKKAGAGTLILSGDNSAYTGTVTLEAGTLGVGHANALGTSTVNVTGDAKLALGNGLSISNKVSVADSVTLGLSGEYGNIAFNGAITGGGTLRADASPYLTVVLGGDNSGFSGAVEVVGTTVDAAHASALGTGILKISSADPLVGTERTSGTVQASAANVALHDVSIELVRTDSSILDRKTPSDSFTVAAGATLYLDIGLLTEATLTGEEVALTIAARNAIDSFFSDVQVGTYVDDAWQISSEWKYLAGSWDVGMGTLKISAIPEPSTFGLLAGLGALALAGTRRRRKKA